MREGMRDLKQTARCGNPKATGHLFDSWRRVAGRIRSAEHLVLFLDFDGTLAPLRRRPEDVPPLDFSTRRLLGRLARHPRVDVYVISGRRRAELRRLIRVPKVHLLGLHGWEGCADVPCTSRESKLVRTAKQLLADRLPGTPGVWLEDKGLGLAVHYREARPEEVRAVRPVVLGVLEQFKPRLNLLAGKKVWELLPCQIDGKGPAVRRILGHAPRSTLPIFAGDDTTDEPAFAALPRGITLRVGSFRRTHARFRVRDTGEVLIFLRRLEAEIE